MSGLQFPIFGAVGPRRYFENVDRAGLAHAYLFSGPPGCGKKTFARQLAQSLLCEAPRGRGVLGYDGTCASCVLFGAAQAQHPDFLEHRGVMKIGSQDTSAGFYEGEELSARDLVRLLSLQSYAGGMRILLLGDIAFAGAPAANALLKFLEEPPEGVLMLLTSAAPGRLLPTIRSRLLEIRFPARSQAETAELANVRGDVATDDDGLALREQVVAWFFTALGGRTPEEGWASRETLEAGLDVVKGLVRDWIARDVAGPACLPALPDQREQVARLPGLTPSNAVTLLESLDSAQRLARTNVPPNMVGEAVRMALTSAATSGA